ncbi:hypothetical protein ABT082_41320, partial [Streptomyces massasporeus]
MTRSHALARDVAYAVVVPTLGGPALGVCLHALAEAAGPGPVRVVLVDETAGNGNTFASVPIFMFFGMLTCAK